METNERVRILLAGGGAAYMTLDVPTGGVGSAKITSQAQPVSAGIDLILVRTR